ncbi:MAG: S-methyl-5-thioribose-1-phosphate isomerase, partial [Candidatus Omnitrophica bacterium]|nr:S-methyl-5-thioribose-1-phosphate isomerase [Candidatus Omnitrophota bacterium]
MRAIKFKNKRLYYIDQTKLPAKELWKECSTLKQGYQAIRELQVRGAPLIGVFAAYCIAVTAQKSRDGKKEFLKKTKDAIARLRSARPTAVNLSWALKRMERILDKYVRDDVSYIKKELMREAGKIHQEDIALCQNMADLGAPLIKDGDNILTHCNAGFLATSGAGTALALIYKAKAQGKKIHVYVDETRPLLQGSRLSAWELTKAKIPCTLISDNMAAYLMQKGKIDKVFVGADRIAANGDAANKIGTYS